MLLLEDPVHFYRNGRYYYIFYLDIPYGRGFGFSPQTIIQLDDYNTVDGCQVILLKAHQNIVHETYQKAMVDMDKVDTTSNGAFGDLDKNDLHKAIVDGRKIHHAQYQSEKTIKNRSAVLYRWTLIIQANSEELLDEQVDVIQRMWSGKDGTVLDPNSPLQYIELELPVGKTFQAYDQIFDYLSYNDVDTTFTSTHENYAGLDFYSRLVLQDEKGVVVGYDTLASQQVTAEGMRSAHVLIDFVRKTEDKSVVAIPRASGHKAFQNRETHEEMSMASCFAQAAANQFTLEGSRVHHIVLNDFNYEKLTKNEIYKAMEDDFSIIDISEISVNALQPYGEFEEGKNLYTMMQKKIFLILNILRNYTLDENSEGDIKTAYRETVKRYYNSDHRKSSFIGMPPNRFPIMTNYRTELKIVFDEAKGQRREGKTDRVERVIGQIEESLDGNIKILGAPTSLKPSDKIQTYYDFSKIGDRRQKNAQFVNILNFIISQFKEGDLLVIHGADVLDKEIYKAYVNAELERLKKRGGKVIFTFDNTTEGANTKIFDLNNGHLYTNFDEDFGWSFIGRIEKGKFSQLEAAFKQPLSQKLQIDIEMTVPARGVFRCNERSILHLIDAYPKL